MVGDHQAVPAESFVLARFMLEPAEQSLLGQQAAHEGKVAFLKLGGDGASRIDAAVCNLPAPGRIEPALADPVAKELVDDLEDRPVLKDVAVTTLPEKREPWLDLQAVARKAAIRTEPAHSRAMTVERPAPAAREAGEEVDADRLTEQCGKIDRRVGGQRGQLDTKAGVLVHRAEALDCLETLGQQYVLAEGRVEPQQAIGLPPERIAGKQRRVDHSLTCNSIRR